MSFLLFIGSDIVRLLDVFLWHFVSLLQRLIYVSQHITLDLHHIEFFVLDFLTHNTHRGLAFVPEVLSHLLSVYFEQFNPITACNLLVPRFLCNNLDFGNLTWLHYRFGLVQGPNSIRFAVLAEGLELLIRVDLRDHVAGVQMILDGLEDLVSSY